MWPGVEKDKDLKLALIGKSGVVGLLLWVWLFRYAFFFWPTFQGRFPGFWVVKLVGFSQIFFNDFFFLAGFVFISLLGGSLAWLCFDFLVYYFG